MIQLKACKRCGGDMLVEEYLGDQDLVCIQCGHRSPASFSERAPARAGARVLAR